MTRNEKTGNRPSRIRTPASMGVMVRRLAALDE